MAGKLTEDGGKKEKYKPVSKDAKTGLIKNRARFLCSPIFQCTTIAYSKFDYYASYAS